jgi:hypothetical protein
VGRHLLKILQANVLSTAAWGKQLEAKAREEKLGRMLQRTRALKSFHTGHSHGVKYNLLTQSRNCTPRNIPSTAENVWPLKTCM